jgi:hypothetical protein
MLFQVCAAVLLDQCRKDTHSGPDPGVAAPVGGVPGSFTPVVVLPGVMLSAALGALQR